MKFKILLLVFLGVALVGLAAYGLFFLNNPLLGYVALNLDSSYKEGESLKGTLGLSLQAGELLPADSKIVFNNNGEIHEYALSEISNEKTSSGDFYVAGQSISGSGEGYGVEGEKIIYPYVYFNLDISTEASSEEPSDSGVDSGLSSSGTEPAQTEETPSQESGITQETTPAETSSTTEEQPITENSQTSQTAESSISGETGKKSEKEDSEKKSDKETSEQKSDSEEKSNENSNSGEKETSGSTGAESAEASSQGFTTTGNVISDFSKGSLNSFWRIVGFVSLNVDTSVEGKVSKGNEFVYVLNKGQTARVSPGSVETESGKKIPNNEVSLNVNDGRVVVTTDYSEMEKGFGEDYTNGDGSKELSIDLSKLDFIPKEGNLKISLVHGDSEIVSISAALSEGSVTASNETSEIIIKEGNETISNETAVNETNGTIVLSEFSLELSDEEKKVLTDNFGNFSVEVTKAEKTNENYLVRFGIGEFWTEHSYPIDLSSEELSKQVGDDMIRFLKDLARKLSAETPQGEEIQDLIGSHSV